MIIKARELIHKKNKKKEINGVEKQLELLRVLLEDVDLSGNMKISDTLSILRKSGR